MPTPVSVARQCLAEEAAATLDDAVAVAKRRSHAQTTSLHAVSALLALPSSSLRGACTRVRSSACSPRLHIRALELCVGVALDKVSACKSPGEDPPVSNSLMAAIKRSQANQRRHPDTFHLYQQQLNSNSSTQTSISAVKVELRHFIVSVLDDPIVSRVFSDAGFQTSELKLAIINPLTMSRFSTSPRCPPLFQWGLSDLESKDRCPNFLLCKTATEIGDANSQRVGEILVKGNKRNPLMIGVCAKDALRNFVEGLKKGETGFLPKEIDGLSLISIDHEFSKFINKDLSEEMMESKFKEVGDMSDKCHGTGIVVNCGDLKPFVDSESVKSVNFLISQLKSLLSSSNGKLWLIGFLAGDDDYKKLLQRFPCIDIDLDLHLLPITSSMSSASGGNSFKSSLMGSFIPFGGFFPMPLEQETRGSHLIQSSSLCNLCSERYGQEVSVLKGTPIDADYHSTTLSSRLPKAECETSKRSDTVEAQDDKTLLDFRVMVLNRKWNDICQQLHHTCTSQDTISEAKLRTLSIPLSHNVPTRKDNFQVDSVLSRSRLTNLSPSISSELLNSTSTKPKLSNPKALESCANVPVEPVQNLEMDDLPNPSRSQQQTTIPSSVISLTTDLGLGTLYASNREGRIRPNLQEHSFYKLGRTHENIPSQEKQMYTKDIEYPWKILSEKFCWQFEAIQTIGRTLLCCRDGDSRHQCPKKGNHWLSFLGPDKVAKRKIATTLAEIVFGGLEHFLSLDLSSQNRARVPNSCSIFDSYDSTYHNMKSERKMIVDYLADELGKRPFSVVLLENIEKADFMVQNSLFQAVKTGKFSDSRGRDISINNVIFVVASRAVKVDENDLIFSDAVSEFSEEKILQARNVQMQILIGSAHGNINSATSVSVTPSNGMYKRKLTNPESTKSVTSKRSRQFSKSFIDLNLPVDDMEEEFDICRRDGDGGNSENSEAWLEELLIHVDENVVFKPFDFDSLAEKILKDIDVGLRRTGGTKILLEIDREVMIQILAAAWLMERENALEDWIEQVLLRTIKIARQRFNATSDFVFKLVACDGLVVEEQAPGVCLPARVIVN